MLVVFNACREACPRLLPLTFAFDARTMPHTTQSPIINFKFIQFVAIFFMSTSIAIFFVAGEFSPWGGHGIQFLYNNATQLLISTEFEFHSICSTILTAVIKIGRKSLN